MNNINETMYPESENMEENMWRAVRHLRFTLEMFLIQIEEAMVSCGLNTHGLPNHGTQTSCKT